MSNLEHSKDVASLIVLQDLGMVKFACLMRYLKDPKKRGSLLGGCILQGLRFASWRSTQHYRLKGTDQQCKVNCRTVIMFCSAELASVDAEMMRDYVLLCLNAFENPLKQSYGSVISVLLTKNDLWSSGLNLERCMNIALNNCSSLCLNRNRRRPLWRDRKWNGRGRTWKISSGCTVKKGLVQADCYNQKCGKGNTKGTDRILTAVLMYTITRKTWFQCSKGWSERGLRAVCRAQCLGPIQCNYTDGQGRFEYLWR